jgi:hypothetical protein
MIQPKPFQGSFFVLVIGSLVLDDYLKFGFWSLEFFFSHFNPMPYALRLTEIFELKILSHHDTILLEVYMPAVSFYLKRDVLDAVRARARSGNIPVSRIISRAVEEYLKTDEMHGARRRVLKHIHLAITPADWEALHRERITADADRD